MKSIAFPKMFNNASTNIIEDHNATESNLNLLLLSDKNELLGDPYFGIQLKKYLHEQNNSIMDTMLIDDIYTAIALFMPQLIVRRQDITLTHKGTTLTCSIVGTNQLNFQVDSYDVVLLREEESA